MIVLSGTDISKAYGTDVILEKVSFHADKGDRIGIVGVNGAGKTTLLEIIAGRMEPDSGTVYLSGNITLGYLRQKDSFDEKRTLREEVSRIYSKFRVMESDIAILSSRITEMAENEEMDSPEYQKLLQQYGDLQEKYQREGGFSYRSEQKGILSSMAFDDSFLDKPVETLSGGERTRLALACLLMEKPDVLMLDEPTNHLDIGMLKWLEQFLRQYSGTVIMVSHDRYFLDQLCTKIFEIQHHHLTAYRGNYTEYARKRKAQREADFKAWHKQQEEIHRQEDMIRRYKQRGTEKLAKRAASREKRLESMERLEKPETDGPSLRIRFHQDYETGMDVLFGEELAKSFGEGVNRRKLFEHVDFDIKKGERVCIVGANGIGKTTLLKIILGKISPDSGYLRVGHNVKFGYYDQRQKQLNDELTVMDEVHDAFRSYRDGEIRGFLGRFLFTDDQVFNPVGTLSGGEKARLALLKLMLSGANVLLLDEPTNHLDIDSREIFEEALREYPGTVLAVSHDRYFLNQVATKIFELEQEGIRKYEGGYDYYEEKKASIAPAKQYVTGLSGTSGEKDPKKREKESAPTPAEERQMKKKRQAEERRIQREQEQLEKRIETLESEIKALQEEMCLPENLSDSSTLRKLNDQTMEKQRELDEAYDRWGEIS